MGECADLEQLESKMTRRIGILSLVGALFAASRCAQADVYTAALTDFLIDSSGEFSTAEFDFGRRFRRIDQVSLKLLAPYGLSGGLSTGSTHYSSAIVVDLHRTGGTPEYDPTLGIVTIGSQSHPNTLRVGFGFFEANRETESRLLPPGARIDQDGALVGDDWPQFLYEGRGDARLQRVDSWFRYMNGSGSGQTLRAPEPLTSVELVIDGVAVPEPAGVALMGLMMIAFLSSLRAKA